LISPSPIRSKATIDGVAERALVIELAACEFIDSTSIAVLVCARNRFAEEGRKLLAG
jgi:anti-anti-sigma regulatory factor